MVNKGFEKTKIQIPRIKAGQKSKGEFKYLGPKSDIRAIQLYCGSCTTCTKEGCYEKDGVTHIPFTYTDPHVANKGTKEKHPSGSINVSKNILVYFEDGTEEFVDRVDKTGKKRNPDTKYESLVYRLAVDIEK